MGEGVLKEIERGEQSCNGPPGLRGLAEAAPEQMKARQTPGSGRLCQEHTTVPGKRTERSVKTCLLLERRASGYSSGEGVDERVWMTVCEEREASCSEHITPHHSLHDHEKSGMNPQFVVTLPSSPVSVPTAGEDGWRFTRS